MATWRYGDIRKNHKIDITKEHHFMAICCKSNSNFVIFAVLVVCCKPCRVTDGFTLIAWKGQCHNARSVDAQIRRMTLIFMLVLFVNSRLTTIYCKQNRQVQSGRQILTFWHYKHFCKEPQFHDSKPVHCYCQHDFLVNTLAAHIAKEPMSYISVCSQHYDTYCACLQRFAGGSVYNNTVGWPLSVHSGSQIHYQRWWWLKTCRTAITN